jgi:hypothetical protein
MIKTLQRIIDDPSKSFQSIFLLRLKISRESSTNYWEVEKETDFYFRNCVKGQKELGIFKFAVESANKAFASLSIDSLPEFKYIPPHDVS